MATMELVRPAQAPARPAPARYAPGEPAYLVLDTESIPDGKLLARVKYAGEDLTPEEAVQRAQQEARERSANGSDFLSPSFQFPVAVCVLRVGGDFALQKISCLDAPAYRPRNIVEGFWRGYEDLRRKQKRPPQLITFNGKGFDLPLLELAAFRYGCACTGYYRNRKGRYDEGQQLDVFEWFGNYNLFRGMAGGLNLLSKLLGKPGKMAVSGVNVYDLFRQGKIREINDYCLHDTLDTYFVWLRTLVMKGEISLEREHVLTLEARDWLRSRVNEWPQLQPYLETWSEWQPWP